MAFTLDTSLYFTGNSNPQTANYTLGANATLLVLDFGASGGPRQGGSPSFSGALLTNVNSSINGATDESGELWALVNPSVGAQYTISIPNVGTARTLYAHLSSYNTSSGYTSTLDSSSIATYSAALNPSTNVKFTETLELVVAVTVSGHNAVTASIYPGAAITPLLDKGTEQEEAQWFVRTTTTDVSVGASYNNTTGLGTDGIIAGVWKQLAAVPFVPTLLSPANNTTNASINATFTWAAATAGSKAASYGFQLCSSSSFITNDISVSGITNTYYFANNPSMNYGINYWWRVNATNATGSSAFTSSWKLTTIAAKFWGGILKYWTGSAPGNGWQECPSSHFKYYSGTSWAKCPSINFKVYTGSAWYPIRIDGSTPFTDKFDSYSDGALGGQGKWLATLNAFNVSTGSDGDKGVVAAGSAVVCISAYNDGLRPNQYSQIRLDTIGGAGDSNAMGVAVHMSGSGATANGYGYYHMNGTQRVWRVDAGVKTNLGVNGTAASAVGDVIRLEIKDTSLFCYRNGVLDTTVGSGGTASATEYTTGQAGISGYNQSSLARGDMWEGGNL